MNQLTFWSVEPLANLFPLPDCEKGLKTQEETSASPMLEFLTSLDPSGAFGKTCQVSLVAMEEGILAPSSGRWLNSGMGSPTECLTLKTSESHKDADVCLLSDVLETGNLPQKFYLSPRACQGILSRAEKRGKKLPPLLKVALETSAQMNSQELLKSVEELQGGGSETLLVNETANCLQTTSNDYSRSDGFNMVVYENHPTDSRIKEVEVSPTVTRRWGTGGGNVPLTQTFCLQWSGVTSQNANGDGFKEEQSYTLNRVDVHGVAVTQPIVLDDQGGSVINTSQTGIVGTLKSQTHGHESSIISNMAVRRLTPVECERLQGFPDNYTDIKPNGKPTPNGPRYAAMGNSMAVPVMKWIGERIQMVDSKC